MMTLRICRLILPPMVVLTASVVFAGETSFDRHFDAPAGGRLTVQTDVGSVSVTGHDSRDIDIHVQVSGSDADRLSFDAKQDASGVTVTGRRKSFSWFQWSATQVKFTISVPRDYPVQIETSGGSIVAGNLNASIQGRTSGGSIDVHDASGTIDMRTSGGSIDASRLNGSALFRTSGGSIQITDARELDVHTSGGAIELSNIDGKLKADTSGGGIHASMRSNHGVTLTTSGGSITLLLPKSVQASVDAQTDGGAVQSELAVSTTGASDRQRLLGTINGGGDPIYLRTSGGVIQISESSK